MAKEEEFLSRDQSNRVTKSTFERLCRTVTMIQMVDRPNTTPISQDKKTLTFKALL